MGARDYDPRLGRWLSADTIVPNPANPQSLNRYSYVYNNPLKYIDPSGHRACLNWDEDGRCTDWENSTAGVEDMRERIIREIESYGPFTFVNPDAWSMPELQLLRDTIALHPFREGWSSAKEIRLQRQDVYRVEGEENKSAGGLCEVLGEGVYVVTIYDSAWLLEPAMNEKGFVPAAPRNFGGNIAHELTHVVIEEHPELVESYLEHGNPDPTIPGVGQGYGWPRGCQRWSKERKAKEMIAMTVAAYMYQDYVFNPIKLYDPFVGFVETEPGWGRSWVEEQSSSLSN